MLDKLDKYLLYEICYYLSNYDIIENLYINKRLTSSVNNLKFRENHTELAESLPLSEILSKLNIKEYKYTKYKSIRC